MSSCPRLDFRSPRTCLSFALLVSTLVCAAGIALPPLSAQSTGPLAPPSDPSAAESDAPVRPLRFDVSLVLVPVLVTDAMNSPTVGLQKKNFRVFENDGQREIRYFSAEDSPISIGLILDLSGSMANKIDAERAAVSQFFENANAQDDYFVIGFSTHPVVLADATQSIGTIQSRLAVATPNGSTALLDAVSLAMTRMNSARYKRRALLIISDGGDNSSHHGLWDIRSLVRDSDVEVYAIGLFDTDFFRTFEEFMGRKWLGTITDSSGGRTVTVDSISKLGETAATISRELRSEYVLGYRPDNTAADGKRRQIKVRLVDTPKDAASLHASYKNSYTIPKSK